jgi:hypothetical protein
VDKKVENAASFVASTLTGFTLFAGDRPQSKIGNEKR